MESSQGDGYQNKSQDYFYQVWVHRAMPAQVKYEIAELNQGLLNNGESKAMEGQWEIQSMYEGRGIYNKAWADRMENELQSIRVHQIDCIYQVMTGLRIMKLIIAMKPEETVIDLTTE